MTSETKLGVVLGLGLVIFSAVIFAGRHESLSTGNSGPHSPAKPMSNPGALPGHDSTSPVYPPPRISLPAMAP